MLYGDRRCLIRLECDAFEALLDMAAAASKARAQGEDFERFP
jgi:hypothetical protein